MTDDTRARSILCTSCGGRNQPDVGVCEFCARPLDPIRTAGGLSRQRWLIPLIGVLIAGCLLILAHAFVPTP